MNAYRGSKELAVIFRSKKGKVAEISFTSNKEGCNQLVYRTLTKGENATNKGQDIDVQPHVVHHADSTYIIKYKIVY